MSYAVVGSCPKCGAPIYSPYAWHGITPPPAQHSCWCHGHEQPVTTASFTLPSPKKEDAKAKEVVRLRKIIEGFYDAIAHGDDEHRTWLKEVIAKYLSESLAQSSGTTSDTPQTPGDPDDSGMR